MIYKLSSFLIVVGLVLHTTVAAAAQQTAAAAPKAKSAELSPELKQNALNLLSTVARETEQFSVPENRVRAQIIVADLTWQHDEPAARAVYQKVFAELQTLFAEMNAADEEPTITRVKTQYYFLRERLAQLRRDYVLSLAAHDSQTAFETFAGLKAKKIEDYDPLAHAKLELQLAAAIIKNSPEKAYALAKEQMSAKGFDYQFLDALKDLHGKNSELAAKLGRDALAKIKSMKIRAPLNPDGLDAATVKTDDESLEQAVSAFYQVGSFIGTAAELNRSAERDKKMRPLLTDAEMKELIDLMTEAYLTARNPSEYAISHLMPHISRYSPAQVQRIRVKIGPRLAERFERITESSNYYYAQQEKSADELVIEAARSAPDLRDGRFVDAVRKALAENEPEKARRIAERIKNKENYSHDLEKIEAAIPLAQARRGQVEQVRQSLTNLKTVEERVATLTELASALAARGETQAAKKLLDEAMSMIMAEPFDQTVLQSAGKIAVGYSLVAPADAFITAENAASQTNQYINAGILLDKFYDRRLTEQDELLYESMTSQILQHIPGSYDLLKNLARADFERTVGLADKFERTEIRQLVRLQIVQALLDPDVAEKAKKRREEIAAYGDDH